MLWGIAIGIVAAMTLVAATLIAVYFISHRVQKCPAALSPDLPCLQPGGHDGPHRHGVGCSWVSVANPSKELH
jgi:hypothetical protein